MLRSTPTSRTMPLRASRRSPLVLLTILLLTLVFPMPGIGLERARAAGAITYVVPGGAGTRSGLDWANGRDLQFALARATSDDELWVKAGTYTPASGSDRTATFSLKQRVALYGGFAGNETALAQRDWTANPTILSGDLLGNDGANFVNNADNSYQVVTADDVDATAILDGFTITAGHANSSHHRHLQMGGGVLVMRGSPTLTNVTISGNAGMRLGGMYSKDSNPVLHNVVISGNSSIEFFGGMYSKDSNPVLRNVTISGNHAESYVGLFNVSSSPVLTNVTISGNAHTGVELSGRSGMMNLGGSNPVVRNSIIWGNSTTGVNIYNWPADDANGVLASTPDVQHSIVEGGYEGTGNLESDPMFVSPILLTSAPTTGGNLRLSTTSPAINAGSNAHLPTDLTTDCDGSPRVQNGTVDLGAYEFATLNQTISFATLSSKTYGDASFPVTATASSGLPVAFAASGPCSVSGTTVSLSAPGTCAITATQPGNAIYGPAASVTRSFSVARATTTTTVSTSFDPIAVGQPLTLTVRVTSASGTPTGSVEYRNGTTVLATQQLVNGTASFTTDALALGRHSIVAIYGGSAMHLRSSGSYTQRVLAISATNLTSSLNPSRYGQSVTFTTQVSGNAGVPSGSVTFFDGTTALVTRILRSGQATLSLSTLSVGTHGITARYNGSSLYLADASPVLRQSVGRALATATLQSSTNPSALGQAVTFTAKVTAASGGTPTGMVTFKDGTTVLGTGTLSRG